MSQARSIALKAHPGKITDEELERERGGSGLRYSFDIKSGGARFTTIRPSSSRSLGVWAFLGVLQYLARFGVHADFLRDAPAIPTGKPSSWLCRRQHSISPF